MSEDPQTLAELRLAYNIEEEMGYDAPFVTFTWQHWQEMQAQMFLSFSRFQRAIEQRQPRLALFIALEMQEVCTEMQKEACSWIGIKDK
jgi:hypothetical protein